MQRRSCAIIASPVDRLDFGFDEESPRAEEVKMRLYSMIFKLLDVGFDEFVTSLEPWCELWSAELIVALTRAKLFDLRLVCAPTSELQAVKWHPELRERYYSLLESAHEVIEPRDFGEFDSDASLSDAFERAELALIIGSEFDDSRHRLIADAIAAKKPLIYIE